MKRQRTLTLGVAALAGAVIALVGVIVMQGKKEVVITSSDLIGAPVYATSNSASGGGVVDLSYAAEQSVNAVVHVKNVYNRYVQSAPESIIDYMFGFREYRQERTPAMGAGSGVILTKDGYIVTNNHVIEKAEEIQVTLNDKRSFTAKVVGTDPSTDIAVLKIDADNLPFIDFGNSDNLRLGEWVLAVGNPLNLTSTVTAGIISAKARNINILSDSYKIESFIQTDAAVNPGNSGGALVNTKGELIGINTAIASPTGTFTGYSFAVPSSIVKKVVSDIIEFGVVQRAVLGVSLAEINSDLAKEYKIKNMEGVFVAGIIENGAAKAAGIEVGDVITKVNDIKINNVSQLQEEISKFRPNDQVSLTVNRDNKTRYINVILRNREGNTDVVKKSEIASKGVLGATFKEVDRKTKQRLRISNGVEVVSVNDGPLKTQGVKKGFIITRVNRVAINNVEDISKALESSKGDNPVLVEGIYPNGARVYFAFPL